MRAFDFDANPNLEEATINTLATKLINELVEAADQKQLTKTIARYGRVDLHERRLLADGDPVDPPAAITAKPARADPYIQGL